MSAASGGPDGAGGFRRQPERIVLRPASSLWTFGIVAAFVLWLFVDAVLRGATEFALTALPWLLLILWTVYVLMLRPCVALGPDGITIVNVFRRHRIPWALVDDFTTRFSLLVRLKDGRAIRSWGAPSTGIDRPFQTGSSDARFAAPEPPRAAGVRRTGPGGLGGPARRSEPTIGSIIEGARDRWDAEPTVREAASTSGAASSASSSTGRQRVSRWEWWAIAVTLVLAAACALTLA
ncbi:PH domain-containing protein [Microbacteriaceae bacterium 4G12]